MADNPLDLLDVTFDHAWKWFSLHASQRMQTFNFFLVATAFLVAGYATLIERLPLAALFVSASGAWVAFWFTRLDNRTRQLINAGEIVLRVCQADLAKRTNVPAVEILRTVEEPTAGAFSYRAVIATIEWTVLVLFTLAAGFAAFRVFFE